MITITINGNKVTADPNKTILETVHEQKLDSIPTLCYDKKLEPFGSCFLCVVEVAGMNKLVPSCATKPWDGMVVQTKSPKVVDARRTCLELLVSNHYADCFGACRLNCPADVDIQGYLSLTYLGKYHEAVQLIKEKNPFPSVCGRVCTRKCELSCRRKMIDDAVGIDYLKRFSADKDLEDMWTPHPKPRNGKKVAIIGGGPAGLTCAYYLTLEGYEPTVFEALPELGGMLRYGIPEYRLPKAILDKEIKWITDLGVEVHTNTKLGRDITLDGLFDQGFKSVFVGLGAQLAKSMGIANEQVKNILGGVDFLRDVTMINAPKFSGRVVVVGGGNTAIDAARTSLRLGASEVVLLYRRTRKEMPANELEIVAAEEEGINFKYLAAPTKINSKDGVLQSMECIEMELGEPDASGRRRPVEKKNSNFTLECDFVISAIGQEADLTGVENGNAGETDIELSKWHTIIAAEGSFNTNRAGVFAGGDVVTGPADAIDAVAAGRMAAFAIQRYIETGHYERLKPLFASRKDNLKEFTSEDFSDPVSSQRTHISELPVEERIHSFKEVELALTEEQAKFEACRCMECGCQVALECRLQDYCAEYGADQKRFVGEFNRYKVDTRHPFITLDSNKCINCGRCVRTCAEILDVSALGFVNRGFRTMVKPAMNKALADTNCVSCGNCVDACPTGAIVNKLPFGRSGPWLMNRIKNVCNFCSIGCNVEIKAKTADLFYVSGSFEGEPNFGELCVRGRYGYQQLLGNERMRKPLIRKGADLVPATWEQAWERIEQGIKDLKVEYGGGALMVAASPKLTNEELYLAGKLARVTLETNAIGSFQRLATDADYHSLDNMLGATTSSCGTKELEAADIILLVNCDPFTENPVLGWRLKRMLKKGKQAIVINSSDIGINRYATQWLDPRRGSSTLLLNGIMLELMKNGGGNLGYLETRTEGFERFKRSLLALDIEDVEAVTGVRSEKISECARLLSDKDRKVVAIYNLDSRRDRSPNDLKALTALMLLTGKIGVEGSGMILLTNQANARGMQIAGFDQAMLPGESLNTPDALAKLSKVWNHELRQLKGSTTADFRQDFEGGKFKGGIVIGENPAIDPEWAKRVEKLEFLVVADMFMTETAKLADVVLPLNSYVEDEGTMTNWEGLRQSIKPLGKPLTGHSNIDVIARIMQSADGGVHGVTYSHEFLGKEMSQLIPAREQTVDNMKRFATNFSTHDGKAHFEVYPTQIKATEVKCPNVLALDERTDAKLAQVFGQK
ncbi:MAG: molybdopterin-dependent oxidoreductase [Candidatus Zixiibacteriota bacterium]